MTVHTGNSVVEGLKKWKQEYIDSKDNKEAELESLKNERELVVEKRRCMQLALGLVEEKSMRREAISATIDGLNKRRKDLDREIDQVIAQISLIDSINEVVIGEIDKRIGSK
ncbi:hypothetical protein COD68_30640 [Bacillus cereus]|uniref:hypothetical protein n=1 Tax=Bacillus cereus TaxID=1396 RepID=UPI000BFE9D4C|nr:hypothetical protein [Bacillus cereus]PGU75365.1 hypothetical protein COD68_30640 [Bacillus cereus]